MKPQSSFKKSPAKAPAERVVKDIRRQTRRHFSAEDKIRIVLDGLAAVWCLTSRSGLRGFDARGAGGSDPYTMDLDAGAG